ncbi:MAG: RAMP superfamily CRISPR-associated protein [Synergistaceae bacterium]|jgi:CRISPR/Cas system CSM-associated protein Csm3 (group 7 of RAMP superfamily)|nr:RAMP superfamily CRISPR-associated protein [Synergistaceae bacterium]
MSRGIAAKIKIEGCLAAGAPVSVGGVGAGDMVDIDLAVDGQGRYYIPGSSIAGPMRSWTETNLTADVNGESLDGSDIADKLFGYMKKNKGDKEGYASFLAVDDAVALCEPSARERRHGISIEESSGTAKKHFFYTRALLPKGTRFDFSMELDVTQGGKELAKGAMKEIIRALSDGEIRFGSCKTSGFGTMRLESESLKVNFYDFSISGELDKWLGNEPSGSCGLAVLESNAGQGIVERVRNDRYKIEIKWAPVSRIMVKSGRDGIATDMLPLVSNISGKISPVIPGTSIKGVLRAQARRIMRTIFGQSPENDEEKYLCIVDDMFGDENRSGRIFVEDVYLASPTNISPDEWIREDECKLNEFTIHEDHVAIDRFTGGASVSALFSARPVPRTLHQRDERTRRILPERGREICWEPIKITIDFTSRTNAPCGGLHLAELALLELVIRDMRNGLVPIGFGTNRGFGDLEINDVDWMPSHPHEEMKKAWTEFIEVTNHGTNTDGTIVS